MWPGIIRTRPTNTQRRRKQRCRVALYDASTLAAERAPSRIWAPWRIQYIKGKKSDECIFCTKPGLDDESALIVRRGERCFVMLNAYPYTSGHVMIAPYEPPAALAGLDRDTAHELIALTQESLRAIAAAYGPEGFNVGANLGTVAGAGVADHVHMHALPRWEGDTNFMTSLADTRVLPESLAETHRNLKEAFARL